MLKSPPSGYRQEIGEWVLEEYNDMLVLKRRNGARIGFWNPNFVDEYIGKTIYTFDADNTLRKTPAFVCMVSYEGKPDEWFEKPDDDFRKAMVEGDRLLREGFGLPKTEIGELSGNAVIIDGDKITIGCQSFVLNSFIKVLRKFEDGETRLSLARPDGTSGELTLVGSNVGYSERIGGPITESFTPTQRNFIVRKLKELGLW